MRKQTIIGIVTIGLALGTVGAVGAGAIGGSPSSGDRAAIGTQGATGAFGSAGPRAVGLTDDQRLVTFRTDRPGQVTVIGKVDGLTGDKSLIGVDYRVQDKQLYAVGDQGGIYTLKEIGATAKKVSQLTVALQGQNFGVDFNPAANRLRVISDTGQNLRHNIDDPAGAPAAGTTAVDGTLTNPTPPGGAALGVTAAAYTNNDLDAATGTTLFDLDSSADQIAVQSPANNGNLAPTGKLGVDAGAASGLDILYSPRSGANAGYAVTRNKVFRVNLLTGQASSLGSLPGARQVVDLALPLNQ